MFSFFSKALTHFCFIAQSLWLVYVFTSLHSFSLFSPNLSDQLFQCCIKIENEKRKKQSLYLAWECVREEKREKNRGERRSIHIILAYVISSWALLFVLVLHACGTMDQTDIQSLIGKEFCECFCVCWLVQGCVWRNLFPTLSLSLFLTPLLFLLCCWNPLNGFTGITIYRCTVAREWYEYWH